MTDITELFNRDPDNLTRSDISLIVEEYRKKYHLFTAGGPKKTAAPKKLTKSQQAASKLDIDLDL